MNGFNYVSLFSGIGGFEQALNKLGGTCVMASEIDKYANQAYEILYGHPTVGDVTKVAAEDVPDHDLLVGGFPCQAFSVAGKRLGFEEARGTLFFEIARIAKVKRPKAMLLENVKGLVGHDGGKTLDTIVQTLHDIGYTVDFEVMNSKYFGVPQNRERIFLCAIRNDLITPSPWIVGKRSDVVAKGKRRIAELGVNSFNFDWPAQEEVTVRLRDILESDVDERFYLSEEKTAKLVAQLSEKEHALITEETAHDGYNGQVYQVESGLSPTLTTNKGEGVKILDEVRPVLTPDRLEKRQNGRRFKGDDEESFTLTAQDKHGVAIGIKEVLDASEKERNTVEILRALCKEVGEETVAKWRLRVLASLQSSEILQRGLYGESIYGQRIDGKSELVHGSQASENGKESGELREMWGDRERRYTPQGRELEEQFAREFTIIMSELPYEGTSSEENLYDLRETTQGSRLLQQALHQIQEVWRSDVPKTRYRIRKLSPRECFRLQSFPNAEFDKLAANGISNSQLYKMAGNAVTVNVIDAIGRRLLQYVREAE